MRMRKKKNLDVRFAACADVMAFEPKEKRGKWRALFGNDNPIHLEIGCGKGVSTARMAHENPGANLIAVDEVRHVLAVSIRNAQAEYGKDPVGNLRFSAVDAMFIHDTFDRADGIERIYINFCNPWDEKAKHHKRRLTHPRQLEQYRAFLAPGGRIYFKTDNDALFTATKRYLRESRFEIETLIDDLHASGYSPNYVSEHEALYAGMGKPIRFLIARMLPGEPFQTAEPLPAE